MRSRAPVAGLSRSRFVSAERAAAGPAKQPADLVGTPSVGVRARRPRLLRFGPRFARETRRERGSGGRARRGPAWRSPACSAGRGLRAVCVSIARASGSVNWGAREPGEQRRWASLPAGSHHEVEGHKIKAKVTKLWQVSEEGNQGCGKMEAGED